MSEDRQALARRYGTLLKDLQARLDGVIAPALWSPRSDPETATRHDGSTVLRVGAINAIGVPTAELDLPAITTAVNSVLTRHGFPAQPPITGSPSGNLICEATDERSAEFTLLIKDTINAWVDIPS